MVIRTLVVQISLPAPAWRTGSANAMDVEFALTQERQFVVLQARPYRIVYSLDRAQRDRPKAGLPERVKAMLRKFALRIGAGNFKRRAPAPV
jgi:hypothetical protein